MTTKGVKLLSIFDVAKQTGLTIASIRQAVYMRQLEPVTRGKRGRGVTLYFQQSEVTRWRNELKPRGRKRLFDDEVLVAALEGGTKISVFAATQGVTVQAVYYRLKKMASTINTAV